MLRQRSLLALFCAALCAAPLLALLRPLQLEALAPTPSDLQNWQWGLDAGLAVLAVLAWKLNQNRLAVAAVGMAASAAFLVSAAGSGHSGRWLADAWMVAVPGGMGLSLLPKEGTLVSGRTFGRTALLLLPAGLAWAVASSDPAEARRWLDWSPGGPWEGTHPSVLAHLSLLVFLGAAAARLHSRIEAALMALAGSLLGLTVLAWGCALAQPDPALLARLWLAGHLAQAVCLALGLFQLYWQRVYLDELTGIPNRRALDERMGHLDGAYSLAMVDIDHFKKFNDTYGHAQGDDVLRMVARHLREQTGARAFRYGGEEFCVLATDLDSDGLAAVMDAARGGLAARRFHIRPSQPVRGQANAKDRGKGPDATVQVQVTVSVGVAQKDKKRDTSEKVMKLADEGLYDAKGRGRNVVVRKN